MRLETPIPGLDVRDGFAKILVISDRHMDRRDPSITHLAEGLRRPIAILQAVDDQGGGHDGHQKRLPGYGKISPFRRNCIKLSPPSSSKTLLLPL